jgi:3-oxoacyl-(acyl-carrier-protein) synthase
MEQNTERRVVITGLGIVAPNGIGKEAFWQATTRGVSGIKSIKRFPTDALSVRVGGEVSTFLASDYVDRKVINRTDRMTHFVFAAIQEALQDAHITLAEENPQRVGAVIANTIGGIEYVMEQIQILYTRGPRYLSAYTAIAWLQVANVGQTAIRYGIQGYCKTPVNDCIGGLDALAIATGAIRRGAADMILTGGSEAMLHPFALSVLAHHGDHCVLGEDPNAYRPFDRRAAGLIMAEGAGICILEDYEHARRRGAPIYGEIVGYGQTNDALGLQAPSSNGKQYARAIKLAMQEAGLSQEDLAYFSLDGRALPSSDQGEVEALHMIFGTDLEELPVSVPRTMQGHSYAAAGAMEAALALIALQRGLIPPTINCEQLEPHYGLNLVQNEARPISRLTNGHGEPNSVLIGGRGVGGANIVVAIRGSAT